MRDEQNKNRQTEEDRFIEAYLNRIDADAPDLWDRIEAGLDREAKDVEEKQKKTSKVKYVIPVLAIAAVLLAAVIATPLLSDSKRHSKEINAGRTTDVSNDGLDAAENSNISDRAEDYVDETADSIPETVQNETAKTDTEYNRSYTDEWSRWRFVRCSGGSRPYKESDRCTGKCGMYRSSGVGIS